MKLLSKVNYTTKKHLGKTGRPLVTGTATAAGLITIGSKYDIELLQNNLAVAGISLVVAGLTELSLTTFGADEGLVYQEAQATLAQVSALDDAQYTALCSVIKSGLDEKDADAVISQLDSCRTTVPPKVKKSEGNVEGAA